MLEYKILTKLRDKESLKKSFLSLFSSVYKKNLDEVSWMHQIINSPYDDSVLFVALNFEKVIGSALMILQKCSIGGREYKYYLFTTSAILQEYRPIGVYAELLKLQKEYAVKRNIDFIFALPNKTAYPVLKFFGGFKDLKKHELIETSFNKLNLNDVGSSLTVDDKMFRWRFEHKDYKFYNKDGVVIIYKEHNGSYDILGMYNQKEFQFPYLSTKIEKNKKITTLDCFLIDKDNIKGIDKVNFTYFPINKDLDYSAIRVNLLMSDVF
jgi:predicted N-acetyltransferase YhbS